jgi:hypothetical protein
MVLIVSLIIIKNNYKRYENRINPIGLKGNEINERKHWWVFQL